MREQQQQMPIGSVSIFSVVQIVFVILKLVGVIEWSWWLVFIPLWSSIGLTILLLIIGVLLIHLVK